jgi:hypothetical protein
VPQPQPGAGGCSRGKLEEKRGGYYQTLIQGEDCFKKRELMMKEQAYKTMDRSLEKL